MGGDVALIGYTCGRYSTYQSSAFQFWTPIAVIAVAVVISLVSHQYYRHRRGRPTVWRARRFRDLWGPETLQGSEQRLEDAQSFRAPDGGPVPVTPAEAGYPATFDGGGLGSAAAWPQPSGSPVYGAPAVGRPPTPPAGWYPDPERPGQLRYWSGAAWWPSGAVPPGVPPPPPPAPAAGGPGWGAAQIGPR